MVPHRCPIGAPIGAPDEPHHVRCHAMLSSQLFVGHLLCSRVLLGERPPQGMVCFLQLWPAAFLSVRKSGQLWGRRWQVEFYAQVCWRGGWSISGPSMTQAEDNFKKNNTPFSEGRVSRPMISLYFNWATDTWNLSAGWKYPWPLAEDHNQVQRQPSHPPVKHLMSVALKDPSPAEIARWTYNEDPETPVLTS